MKPNLGHSTMDGGQTWEREKVEVPVGQLRLTHDGTTLTVADLIVGGKVTVLRATTNP